MSPEQHFGGSVGPYSDLFSFSITLYEALYGFRPFEGDTWKKIQEKVKRSLIPAPPIDSPVPRWVHRIVLRGLAFHHEDRWPSVEAMVMALENDPRRARLRVVGLASLVVAASAGSYGLAMNQLGRAQVCEGVESELQGVWGAERKKAVHDAFTATGAAFAEDSWRRVELRLDAFASAWVEGRRSICGADASGTLSEGILEARLGCIARRKAYLSTLVDVLGAADREVVENAVQASASLPSVATCEDVDLLLSETRRPDDPVTALRVEALRVQLSRAEVLESTGLYEDAAKIVSAVREEASELGFGPLEAEAALREGSLRIVSGRIGEATEVLDDALEKALVHDLHAIAAEAAAKRIFALGEGERHVSEALAGAPVARALVARARGDWRLSALLNNNLGVVYLVDGDLTNAVFHFERTIATIPAQVGGAEPLRGVSHHNLGNAYIDRERYEEASSHYSEAVSAMTEALGENHPMVAHPMAGLGDVALKRGAYDDAEGRYEQALTTMEAAYGPGSLYLVQPLTGLGEVALRSGRPEEAQERFEQVVAVSEGHGIETEYLATSLIGLGEIAGGLEDFAGALGRYERAVDVREATGADVAEIADAVLMAGDAARRAGDRSAAAGWYERVLLFGDLDPEAPQRAQAGLALAASLGPDKRARVCALARAAQEGTLSEDERAEAERLQAKTCR